MATTAATLLSLLLAGEPPGAGPLPTVLPSRGFVAHEGADKLDVPGGEAADFRHDALARARLWWEGPIARANLPRGHSVFADEAVCKFQPDDVSGRTPKFKCVFEGGEVLKVKYGRNPEVHTEVAASLLLLALGAGADRMYLVKTLRCFGCPEDPDAMNRCIWSPLEDVRRQCRPTYGKTKPSGEYEITLDLTRFVDFQTVAIERRLEGHAIEAGDKEGWGWDELDEVQGSRWGHRRAERDALRLLAAFLNNWDNRPDNQRLLCLPGGNGADGRCTRPFAYMHDVGATFGHVGGESKEERKLDVEGWSRVPIWKDPANCVVRIESPPLHGASFGEATISESGRRFLALRLRRMTASAIRDLFEGARFADYEGASPASRDTQNWVKAFQGKVRQIADRGPCPTP